MSNKSREVKFVAAKFIISNTTEPTSKNRPPLPIVPPPPPPFKKKLFKPRPFCKIIKICLPRAGEGGG